MKLKHVIRGLFLFFFFFFFQGSFAYYSVENIDLVVVGRNGLEINEIAFLFLWFRAS